MLPSIIEQNGHKILYIHGKPLILLAGEVHNSNSSSLKTMEKVWEKAEALGMNALLVPVTWELVEPVEGKFDFTLVDGLIAQARARGKKLGLLWFGAWKNAQCYYAPAWVKTSSGPRWKRGRISSAARIFTACPIPRSPISVRRRRRRTPGLLPR